MSMMKKTGNMISRVLIGSLLLVSLFSPFLVTKSVAATKEGKNAVIAYRRVLQKAEFTLGGEKHKAKYCSFAGEDINHDGIPELFLRTESGQEVYTYYNGKIVFVESFMAGHMLQYFDKGNILRAGRFSYGTFYEGIYQLSKVKLKGVASCSEDEMGENGEYSVKKKKVSKKKYDKYVKNISKNSKYYDVEYQSISKENLKKYL